MGGGTAPPLCDAAARVRDAEHEVVALGLGAVTNSRRGWQSLILEESQRGLVVVGVRCASGREREADAVRSNFNPQPSSHRRSQEHRLSAGQTSSMARITLQFRSRLHSPHPTKMLR